MRLRVSSTIPALAAGSTNDFAWYWRRLSGAMAIDRVGVAVVLSVAFAVLYVCTQTRDYTFDAISYSHQVQLFDTHGDRMALFHPHHLLFNLTVWLLWKLSGHFGYHGEPLQVAMTMNSILGGIGIGLLWLVLRAVLTRSRALALLFSSGLGVSFGYWVCATDGRVNMPSLVLLIAAFLALVATMQAPRRRRAVIAGVLTALASLYHESAVLFVGASWIGIAMAEYTQSDRADERKARMQLLGWYTLAFAITFGIPYLSVGIGYLGLKSPHAFHSWAARYAELGWWWDFNVIHNLRIDAYAMRKALFVEPGSKTGTFHISPPASKIGLALYMTVVAMWLFAVYQFLVVLGVLVRTHYRPYLIVAMSWVFLNTAFFTRWDPEYFVFRVQSIIASAIILAIAASLYRARRSGPIWVTGIGVWVLLFGISNYAQSIGPHEDPRSNVYLQESWWVVHHSQPQDLYVMTGMGETEPIEVYLPYFAGRNVYAIHTELGHHHNSLPEVSADMTARFAKVRASGGVVYAFDDIWHDTAAQAAMWKKHRVSTPDLMRLFSDQDRTLAYKQDSRGFPVWTLTPLAGSAAPTAVSPEGSTAISPAETPRPPHRRHRHHTHRHVEHPGASPSSPSPQSPQPPPSQPSQPSPPVRLPS